MSGVARAGEPESLVCGICRGAGPSQTRHSKQLVGAERHPVLHVGR